VSQLRAEARGLPVLREAYSALADQMATWKAKHDAVAARNASLEHEVAALQMTARESTAALAAAGQECAELRRQVSQFIVEKAAQTKAGLAPTAPVAGSGGSSSRPPLLPGSRG